MERKVEKIVEDKAIGWYLKRIGIYTQPLIIPLDEEEIHINRHHPFLKHCLQISRRHACFQKAFIDRWWRVKDLGSTNGLYINNSKIMPLKWHPLHCGDKIGFGISDGKSEAEFEFILCHNYPPHESKKECIIEDVGVQVKTDPDMGELHSGNSLKQKAVIIPYLQYRNLNAEGASVHCLENASSSLLPSQIYPKLKDAKVTLKKCDDWLLGLTDIIDFRNKQNSENRIGLGDSKFCQAKQTEKAISHSSNCEKQSSISKMKGINSSECNERCLSAYTHEENKISTGSSILKVNCKEKSTSELTFESNVNMDKIYVNKDFKTISSLCKIKQSYTHSSNPEKGTIDISKFVCKNSPTVSVEKQDANISRTANALGNNSVNYVRADDQDESDIDDLESEKPSTSFIDPNVRISPNESCEHEIQDMCETWYHDDSGCDDMQQNENGLEDIELYRRIKWDEDDWEEAGTDRIKQNEDMDFEYISNKSQLSIRTVSGKPLGYVIPLCKEMVEESNIQQKGNNL